MPIRYLIVVLCCAAGLPARAAETQPALEARPRIIKGNVGPESEFPTVCILSNAAGDFRCSGTLISPRHVLTAGHCAFSEEIGGKIADLDGRVRINGRMFSTSRILLHPNYNEILIGDEGIVDAAIFELDTPVDGITPSPIFRDAPAPGTPLLLAGFGLTKYGGPQKFPPPGAIVSGPTILERITATTLEWTFDKDESDTAPGDSGGPAFIDVGGVLTVAGITSLGISPSGRFGRFGTVSIDTRVDAIANWIDSVVIGTSNNPPQIAVPASASPSPPPPGAPLQFDVSATDPDGDPLAFIWDFGDGSAAQGPTQTHSYVFPGSYDATVTVSDGIAGASSIVTFVVPPESVSELALKKLQLSVNFSSAFSDSFSIQGVLLPFPPDDLSRSSIKLDVGGAVVSFDLDSRGHARSEDGSIAVSARTAQFSARINKNAFAQFWRDDGIDDIGADGLPITMPVKVTLNGHEFLVKQPLLYKSVTGRSGKAMSPR